MVMKDTNINQNIKNKRWLSIERNNMKSEKMPYYNYKKLSSFLKICFFLRDGPKR